mmetsp:Transcript_673/g.1883  ORF Transcript_673/g.1883 Transcript_673/m.1883 type:complete len:131 (-) Transcript_673:2890-3282(-)
MGRSQLPRDLAEAHTRNTRLLIWVTAAAMVCLLVTEWAELSTRPETIKEPYFQESAFRRQVRGDGDDVAIALLAEPATLAEKIQSLKASIARARESIQKLDGAFDELEPIATVRERVRRINKKILRQKGE